MSDADDQIAKLEALLHRVRSRSLSPRSLPSELAEGAREVPGPSPLEALDVSPVPPALPPAPARPSPPAPPAAPPPPSPPPPPVSATPAPPRKRHTSRPEVPVGLFTMRPPERYATAPSVSTTTTGTTTATSESDSPMNGAWFLPDPPPMEVVELEVDPDPSIPPPGSSGPALEDASAGVSATIPEPLESRSRLVIAPSSFPGGAEPRESADEPGEPFALATSDPTIKATAEIPREELELEEDEEAPSSSRRPISLEEKMSEPDDAPTHTPPPASGRIPAASPLELALDAPPDSRETRPVTPIVEVGPQVSLASVVRPEPLCAEVAVFVDPPPGEEGAKTFGELLAEALSL